MTTLPPSLRSKLSSRAAYTRGLPTTSATGAAAALEPLGEADGQALRQDLNRQRDGARRAPIADGRTQRPAGNHIGLPMGLTLQARERIVRGQQLERPDPGILPCVVRNERRDKACLQRDLSA